MTHVTRLFLVLVAFLVVASPLPALAECGGSTQCISIGRTPAEADTNHHGGGSGTFTLDFGSQPVGSTSASQVAYVAAVTGPVGTMADLGPIFMSGGDVASFLITGGSCSDANGPVHGGAQCTIAIAFNPVSTGTKTANVHVPVDNPCVGCVTERVFTVTGVGTQDGPVITSPLTAAGTVGVPFAGYQITASGTPTTFSASGLPPGLVVSGSGLISGTPTAAGTFNTTITVSNATGSDSRTLVFTINPASNPAPTVTSLSVSAPYETTIAIPLAGAVSGQFTTLAIASMPAHGIATLAGTTVTYTPALGYSGPDSFTFTATGPGGTSAPGTVQITVGTLAPTAGAAAMTVNINSAATLDLRPFITGSGITRVSIATQPARGAVTANGTSVTYTPNPNAFGSDSFTYVAIGNAGSSAPATVTVTIVGRPDPTRDAAVTGLLEAQSSAAQRFSAAQVDNFQRRMESLHRGAGGTARERTNLWVGGAARFGERGTFDFRTSGVTLGVDRRVSERFVVGAGLGAARDESELAGDGGASRARGFSGAAYASFQPGPNTFIDAVVGGGRLDFESSRFVAPLASSVTADRDGSQVFASVAAGYEHRRNGVVVSPYARLDASRDRIDAATEAGGAPYALTYSGQSVSWLSAVAGLRAEAAIATRFGWTTPRLRAEYRRHLRGERTTHITYADLVDGQRFTFSSRPEDRDGFLLGLGTDFVLRGGTTIGLEYQTQRSGGHTDQLVRLNLSQELMGTGSLRWLDGLFIEATKPLDLQLDAGFTYDDNVTRALAPADRRHDRSFSANARWTRGWLLSNHVRGVANVSLGGEKFQYHDGLSRATAGVKGELQYRGSASFGAPTWTLFAQAATEQYESRLRDGERYQLGASVRIPLTDRLGAFASAFHQRTHATSHVFDGRVNGARVNLDWSWGQHSTLYVAGEHRRGDHVTSANPAGEHLALHKHGAHQVEDDAFRRPDLVAARFEGRSWMGTVGWNWALGPRDALDVSWRRVRTTPDNAADVVVGFYVPTPPVRYTVNQFFVLYLLSF